MQCCVLIEHVFKHGFKTGSSMAAKFATRKGPWGVVEAFEKTSSGVADLCQDVRAIKAITTNTGRLRAWIRMALQQVQLTTRSVNCRTITLCVYIVCVCECVCV